MISGREKIHENGVPKPFTSRHFLRNSVSNPVQFLNNLTKSASSIHYNQFINCIKNSTKIEFSLRCHFFTDVPLYAEVYSIEVSLNE